MVWIVVIIIAVLFWYLFKSTRQTFDNGVLSATYLLMLLRLVKNREEFEKLIWSEYVGDSNWLPIHDFNKKWETLCKATKIEPIYTREGGSRTVSSKVVDLIIENIYDTPANKRILKQLEGTHTMDKPLSEYKNHGKWLDGEKT